jgi:ABC-type Na+ efflux pump permease subunit
MNLLLAIPVTRRSLAYAAKTIPAALLGLAVMYFAFGIFGALVLAVVLLLLGRLLVRAARGR